MSSRSLLSDTICPKGIRLIIFFILFLISVSFVPLRKISPIIEITFTDDFLLKPFDLQKFKMKKGQSNSGGANKQPYYYKPNPKGIYYGFLLFPPYSGYIGEVPNNDIQIENGLSIVTYKPLGKYQDMYLDPTETLIEVTAIINDNDLPELAFVGVDTSKIKNKLGDHFFRKDSCFIYAKDNNALTLKIAGKKVQWLKYTRLNINLTKDNIPAGLLKME